MHVVKNDDKFGVFVLKSGLFVLIADTWAVMFGKYFFRFQKSDSNFQLPRKRTVATSNVNKFKRRTIRTADL